MDGSERIEEFAQDVEEEAVVAAEEETVVPAEEATVTYNISQPQVIVERLTTEELIVEEDVGAGEQQNGTATTDDATTKTTTTLATTLNDIIADAVEGNEEDATDAPPVTGEADESKASVEDEEAEAAQAEETPTRKKQEQTLDLNQCRCCKSREDLQDIFQVINDDVGLTVSAVLVKLCPAITITKRDHLPNVACKTCVQKAEAAWLFREQCEKTDKELRTSLPRAKAKVRKRTDYTLIDFESSSGEDAGEMVDDEDEFKLSDELEEGSEPSDSDKDSVEERPRKRGRPRKHPIKPATPAVKPSPGATPARGRGRPPKYPKVGGPTPVTRKPIAFVETKEEVDSEEDSDEQEKSPAKVVRRQCVKCKAILAPRGPHTCRVVSFACSFCAEKFPTQTLYMNHQQLHTNFQNANTCVRCHRHFPTKPELRKHQSGVRCSKALKNNCLKCGKLMAKSQLPIHIRNQCQAPVLKPTTTTSPVAVAATTPGTPSSVKKEIFTPKKEKNLFKFVAPPTSTYWSDSFSD